MVLKLLVLSIVTYNEEMHYCSNNFVQIQRSNYENKSVD